MSSETKKAPGQHTRRIFAERKGEFGDWDHSQICLLEAQINRIWAEKKGRGSGLAPEEILRPARELLQRRWGNIDTPPAQLTAELKTALQDHGLGDTKEALDENISRIRRVIISSARTENAIE